MRGIEENEKQYVEATLGPFSFCIRASNGQNCLSFRGCTYYVNKKWRISLELSQCRDAWPEVCVVELLNRWVGESVNREGIRESRKPDLVLKMLSCQLMWDRPTPGFTSDSVCVIYFHRTLFFWLHCNVLNIHCCHWSLQWMYLNEHVFATGDISLTLLFQEMWMWVYVFCFSSMNSLESSFEYSGLVYFSTLSSLFMPNTIMFCFVL
jgi:hypothetical protein